MLGITHNDIKIRAGPLACLVCSPCLRIRSALNQTSTYMFCISVEIFKAVSIAQRLLIKTKMLIKVNTEGKRPYDVTKLNNYFISFMSMLFQVLNVYIKLTVTRNSKFNSNINGIFSLPISMDN